jgi:hypothetical protein
MRHPLVGETNTFHQAMVMEVADDIKRTLCGVAEVGFDAAHPPEEKTYELPDGNVVKLRDARQQVCEVVFRAEATEQYKLLVQQRSTTSWFSHYHGGVILRSGQLPQHQQQLHAMSGHGPQAQPPLTPHQQAQQQTQPIPLQTMIYQALLTCHPDMRREMCHHGECCCWLLLVMFGFGAAWTLVARAAGISETPTRQATRTLLPTPRMPHGFCSHLDGRWVAAGQLAQAAALGAAGSDPRGVQVARGGGPADGARVCELDRRLHPRCVASLA